MKILMRALLSFVAGLSLISIAACTSPDPGDSSYAEERARDRFDFQVEEAQLAIKKRMLDYEQMLRGGVGLFNSAGEVSRSMWHHYINTLEINRHYP